MSATCDRVAERITTDLGFSCHDVNPVATLRNPGDLANWTLPVLELTIIAGAVWALVHAVRRWRDGDPTNLALWFASLVYLFVIEPPLYFPEWFGLQESVGIVFVHNVFSVQFMFDRLPLYIIAIYPTLSALAYEVVRSLGVFQRRGPLAGALCVALVNQAFYEIFDQLGPQLKWWAWNLENDANHPLLASVPLNSMLLFASVSFGVLTYLVARLVAVPTLEGRPPRGFGLVGRIVLAGALTPVAMPLVSIPNTLAGPAQGIVLTIELALLWLVGARLLWLSAQSERTERLSPFARIYPLAYLIVFAALWASALPEYFEAVDGTTSSGTPTGSLTYTMLCFVAAGWWARQASASKHPTQVQDHLVDDR